MAESTETIECPECGRVHEVDPVQTGAQFQCECGKVLDVPMGLPEAEATRSEDEREQGGLIARLKGHWKTATAVAGGVIAVLAFLGFWKAPEITLAFFGGGQGAPGTGDAVVREDPEIYLQILEDNSCAEEHPKAAARLLQMEDPEIVPRLCQIGAREDLTSRTLVLRLLGLKGNEGALKLLGPLLEDKNRTLAHISATSITQIDSPLAESLLREHIQLPGRARELLPSIAAVRNDTAQRIVGAGLANPALRSLAMAEITKNKLKGCVPSLYALAADRSMDEFDRMQCIEALGKLDSVEARRALVRLLEDSSVAWKVRQVLDANDVR